MLNTKTVLVTGAAGYMASWVVAQLLERGHRVNATVRDVQDYRRIEHLYALAEKHQGQLNLYEADLLKPGSFDAAMVGCEVVIHTASPYFLDRPQQPEAQLITPAHKGTLSVLESVNKTESVKRVVLTSSVVALYNDACDMASRNNLTVQEGDINANQDTSHNTYAYSKTVAEQAAWKVQKAQQRWDLITIHPGAIFGPSLSRRVDATSVKMMIKFINGSFRTGVPRLWLGLVDVRDVAAAHVAAATLCHANNRYIAVAESMPMLEIAKRMHLEKFNLKDKLPRRELSKFLIWLIAPLVGMQRRYVARNVNYPVFFNNQRSMAELNIIYRPTVETLNDHVAQIVDDGLLGT